MKSFLSLIVVILFSLIGFSQERITEITSKGSSYKFILQSVEDENYVIAFTKFDSIKIYRMEGESLDFLHSVYYPCIYDENYFVISDQFLFLDDLGRASIYNFINNSFYEIPVQSSFEFCLWNKPKSGKIVLHKRNLNSNETNNRLVDYYNNSYSTNLINNFIYDFADDNYIYTKNMYGSDEYYHFNSQTNSNKLIAEDIHNVHFENSDFYYLTDEGLYKYNLQSNETIELYSLSGILQRARFEVNENYLLVYYYLNASSSKLIIIDRETFETEIVTTLKLISWLYPEALHDQLVFASNGILFLFNLNTKEFEEYRLSQPNIRNVYFHGDLVFLSGIDELFLLNTKDASFSNLDLEISSGITLFESSFQIDEKLYLSFVMEEEDRDQVYIIDLDEKKAEFSDFVLTDEVGLIGDSHLYRVGEDLVLHSDNLYRLINDELVQLNTEPIEKVNGEFLNVHKNKISWVQKSNNGTGVYTFENGETLLNARIPFLINPNQVEEFKLEDYAVINYKTYFVGQKWGNRIRCYDSDLDVFSELEDIDLGFAKYEFFTQNNHVYFSHDSLRVINENSDIITLESEYENHMIGSFLEFKDELYFKTDTFFYRLIDEEIDTILDLSSSSFSSCNLTSEYLTFRLTVMPQEYSYLVFNGELIDPISVINNQSFNHLNDNYFVVKSNLNNTSSIFDINSSQSFELPDSISLKSIHKIFVVKDETLLVVGENVNGKTKVVIYKTNKEFNSFVKLVDFNIDDSSDIKYKQFSDNGLFYFGNRIFWISDTLDFHELKSIKGDIEFGEILIHQDYYYFIGIDPIYGRQVFRLPLDFEEILDSTNDEIFVQNLEVYPNPASNKLTIKSDLIQANFKYRIFNILGKQISTGISNHNDIDTSQLHSGNYILIVKGSDGQFYITRFVKIGRG